MNFLSIEWVSIIVAVVSVYWLIPGSVRIYVVMLSTLLLLGFKSPESATILICYSIATYILMRGETISGIRTIVALAFVLGVLAWFKIRFFDAGGRAGDIVENVAIPLGLSYYSFRCAHFIIERYRNTLEQPRFRDYLAYLFFLPTIVVGPINRFQEFLNEAKSVTWSASRISDGLERLLFGYFKVAVLGHVLVGGQLGDFAASFEQTNEPLSLYLTIVKDGLLLYFLFAGFSDIAIGFGLLLGIRVLENFNWPYLKENIGEFWRCWHISLSSWCRDYVYFPVLGLTRNPHLATLASFTAIGLWHEISFRYIAWGLFHGVGILIWRRFQNYKRKRKKKLAWAREPVPAAVFKSVSTVLTMHYVFFGLVIVNQPNFSAVFDVYSRVLLFWW